VHGRIVVVRGRLWLFGVNGAGDKRIFNKHQLTTGRDGVDVTCGGLVHYAAVGRLLCTLHEQCVVAADCVVSVVEVSCGCELLSLQVQRASQLLTLCVFMLACMLFVF